MLVVVEFSLLPIALLARNICILAIGKGPFDYLGNLGNLGNLERDGNSLLTIAVNRYKKSVSSSLEPVRNLYCIYIVSKLTILPIHSIVIALEIHFFSTCQLSIFQFHFSSIAEIGQPISGGQKKNSRGHVRVSLCIHVTQGHPDTDAT